MDEESNGMKMILMPLALILMVGVLMAFLPALLSAGLTIDKCLPYLTDNGYYVVANGQCAATNIVPCTDNTYDIGSIGARWKDIYAVKYIGNGGSLTGITSVYMVAAVDATEKEKSIASFQCNGVNDQVEIMAAGAAANGRILWGSSGTFTVGNAVDSMLDIERFTFRGQGSIEYTDLFPAESLRGGTQIVTVGTSGVHIKVGGYLKGVGIKTNYTASGTAIIIGEAGVGREYSNGILEDISISGDSTAIGTGAWIHGSDSGGYWGGVADSTFNDIAIQGFEYGAYLSVDIDGYPGGAYVNGNTMVGWRIDGCAYPIWYQDNVGSPTHSGQIFGNTWPGLHIKAASNYTTVDAITYAGTGQTVSVADNINRNVHEAIFWDWGDASGEYENTDDLWKYLEKNQVISPDYNVTPVYSYLVDGNYEGRVFREQIAANVTKGQSCYRNSGGEYVLTDANAGTLAATGDLAIALEDGSAWDTIKLLKEGEIRIGSVYTGFTTGLPIYLSGTPGALTQVETIVSGEWNRQVGYAESENNQISFSSYYIAERVL